MGVSYDTARSDLGLWFRAVDLLREQSDWARAEGPVEVKQTHISVVLIGSTQVLKLKKPVDFGFLNYTTPAKRRHCCEEEVRLNRRLCADTYLGVRSIVEVDGVPQVLSDGPAMDYAVLMRRLPEDRMLDDMVRRDTVTESVVDRIAARLARFHDETARGPEIDKYGTIGEIRRNWRENFEQTRAYIGRTITAACYRYLRVWVDSWLSGHSRLLDRRLREGRIVDGHGDVRCESISVTGEICMFDCIEFNERFRCDDVASEAAFLAMDLDSRGRPDLGYYFTERYRHYSRDADLFLLLPFYRCYRAYVRGKVQSFRLDEPEFNDKEKRHARARAEIFFDLAQRYASPLSKPAVIVVGGLSGTGKTSLARAIAGELGIEVVSTDAVRADLFGDEKHPSAYGEGAYSPEASRRTYQELMSRGRRLLRTYGQVVLDGTFLDSNQQDAATALAADGGAELRTIECRLDEGVVRERLEKRHRLGDGVSDASWDTYRRQRELYPRMNGGSRGAAFIADTSQPLLRCAQSVCDWLRLREG